MWSSTSSEWKIPPVHLKCCWTCGITTAQDKLPLVCVAVLGMLMWPHHDTGLKFCIIYQKSIPVESTNRLSSTEHQLRGNPLQVLLPRQSRKAELLFQKKNSSPDRRFCSARPQTCMFKNSKMLLSHKCFTVSVTSGKQQYTYTTPACRAVLCGESRVQWLKCFSSLCASFFQMQ